MSDSENIPEADHPEEWFERLNDVEGNQDDGNKEKNKASIVHGYTGRLLSADDEGLHSKTAHTWLVIFTDTMALLLTFFVLMHAMSEPDDEKWTEMAASLNQNYGQTHVKEEIFSGTQETITIEKVNLEKALDLEYLKALLQELQEEQQILKIMNFDQFSDHIEIRFLVSDFFNADGFISEQGVEMAKALNPLLSKLKNRAEIVYFAAEEEASEKHENDLLKSLKISELLYESGSKFLYPIRSVNASNVDQVQNSRFSLIIWDHTGRASGFVSVSD